MGKLEPARLIGALNFSIQMPNACQKAVSFLAENSGVIAALTQQEILTGDPEYAFMRIPEARYDTGKGHSPRYVEMRTTPPKRTKYVPLLPTGNTDYTINNPQTGVPTSVSGDETGRGCGLPAEKVNYGYRVKNRCLMGKALEAGPWCIMDLLEKEAFKEMLARLWADMPRYAKEDFGRQLLRDVVQYGYWLFSVAEGFPMSTQTGMFPTRPTGGPSIGFLRKIENLLQAQGWAKGAGTPMIGGRVAIQVRMSREAIEWAIARRKEELGLTLDSRVYIDDGVWGKTVVYEGIQFIEAALPTRGYLREIGVDQFEFVEIDPIIVSEAEGEGFWPNVNPEYYNSYVTDNGARYRVLEIGHIIHPLAAERQALGAIPSVKGKTFTRNFDFEVAPIPDWELADRGCNKDMFYFGYRMLHAYALRPKKTELMTAFLYLAPSNQYEIVDPWSDLGEPTVEHVSLAPLADQQATTCVPCDGDAQDQATDPTNPTCDDLFPTNDVGELRLQANSYGVQETAGNLTIGVERVGGSSGPASCNVTITEGTATSPENYDIATGTVWDETSASVADLHTALAWADGESGVKYAHIPIVEAAGDDDGKQFTVEINTPVGATIDADRDLATVTIIDSDNA